MELLDITIVQTMRLKWSGVQDFRKMSSKRGANNVQQFGNKSDRKEQILYVFTYMQNLKSKKKKKKKKKNKRTNIAKRNRLTDTEDKPMPTRRKRNGGGAKQMKEIKSFIQTTNYKINKLQGYSTMNIVFYNNFV